MIAYRSARGQWVAAADIQLGGRVCVFRVRNVGLEGTAAATAIARDGRREGKASLFTAALAAAAIRARVVRPRRQRRWPQCPRPPLARSHFMTLITRFAEGGREGQREGRGTLRKRKRPDTASQPQVLQAWSLLPHVWVLSITQFSRLGLFVPCFAIVSSLISHPL